MIDPIKRRTLLGGSAAAAAVVLASGKAAYAAGTPITAAVLEFRDPWTKATGVAKLLQDAKVGVVDLDPAKAATDQDVDLIVFGGFTNNDKVYPKYIVDQAASLQDFVAAGGVVLDMTQSDQFTADVPYLPDPMSAGRSDPDFDTIYPSDPDHPLIEVLPTDAAGLILANRTKSWPVSYETLLTWNQMRILAAATTTGQPPCLLEGQHGKGRFLITSLTLDKCFDANDAPLQPEGAIADSAGWFTALAGYVQTVKDGTATPVVPTPVPTEPATGPMIGHTTENTTRIWARPGADHRDIKKWQVSLRGERGLPVVAKTTMSDANDYTVLFDVKGLRPATRYAFEVTPVDDSGDFIPLTGSFTTNPNAKRPSTVVMGMGSCAPSSPDAVWDRVVAEGCDSFVWLGDTPYVDSTELVVARRKHREFLQQPPVARMMGSMPVWATWDDHDFGGNDSDGTEKGKRNNRTAFVDYRANVTFGQTSDGQVETTRTHSSNGVYTSFRRGPIEMFLLDPRWWSQTGPSFADPSKPGCLGLDQWQWLKRALKASTATFKVIASGMDWDDKENSEKDDWGTYLYEREAIFDFVKKQGIKGVVLLAGDIHVSRALNYGPRVGYDLWQFIVSPMHDSTIPSLNVPSPYLVHSAVEPNVFMKMVADTTVSPARLTSTWINRAGKRIFSVDLTADQLGY